MKEKKKKSGHKQLVFICVLLTVCIAGTVLFQMNGRAEEEESVYKETTVQRGDLVVGVTESGSMSIGILSQTFDLGGGSQAANAGGAMMGQSSAGSTSKTLTVEAVYVTTGQEVEAGEPLLKLTEDSIADYRQELSDAVTTAGLNLKQEELSLQEQELKADYTYQSNLTSGFTAQAEYDAAIAKLAKSVTDAEKELAEAAERIAELPVEISDKMQELSDTEDDSQKTSIQKEIDTLNEELEKLNDNYSTLQLNLDEAKRKQTTESITARQKYEEAMLNYKNAANLYAIDTNGLDDTLQNLQDALDDAQDALDEFEAFVGDGTILTEYGGKIMSVGYAAGDTLSASTAMADYADASNVTVTVSVAQEDVSAAPVGKAASVELLAYEDQKWEGSVTSVATAASSSSTVSYNVTVTLAGDVSGIFDGMTGNVTFVTKEVDGVLYVSNKAVLTEGTRTYVKKKAEDGSLIKTEVTCGFSDGVNVEIQSGLSEGETVIIESKVKAS